MLTPQEITDKVFVKAVFGGYDMTGVDDFLEAIYTDYTALYKENAILKGKLKVLVEKVEEYRSTEDAMRMALLTAQRMGEEVISDANKKKDEILQDADLESNSKIAETAKRIADEELRLSVAAKETAKFIELSQMILRKHSEFLSRLEAARRVVRPDEEPKPEQPAPPSRQTTREAQIADVAEQIGNAIEKLANADAHVPNRATGTDAKNEPEFDDDGEPTKTYTIGGDDDAVTPRPKFDFENLQFGANLGLGTIDK
ncbi:MAG: DivIVA domain-containing protein [Oscillospiraceae bacterium]|jgi:cell division initiation protein|nr:DivIVA domain-containing protein [Oscillospiraceae bacterium]